MMESNTVSSDLGVTKDSDEVFEMYCESCHREGTVSTATAFCPSCVDHLCTTCSIYHRRFLPDHEYLDKDNMSRDICLEKCDTHKDEIIKFYCAACKTFACSVCKKSDHKGSASCSMKYLPDLVNDLRIESGLKELSTRKDDVVKNVSKTEQIIKRKQEIIGDIPGEAKQMLKNETEAMLPFFFKEMQTIEDKIETEAKQDNGRIETLTEKSKSLKLEVDKMLETHKQSSNSSNNQKYKTFIKLKNVSKELEDVTSSLRDMEKQCTASGDKLKSSVKLQVNDLTKRVKTITTAVRTFGIESKRTHVKEQRKTATEEATFNVKVESDCEDCQISNCFLLTDRYLFMCDSNNSSVKLVDTKTRNLLCIRPVDTPPRAATRVNNTEIAIVQAHQYHRKRSVIQFLTLTKAKLLFFQKKRSIQTEMECSDIIYSRDRLIISLLGRSQCKVQIVDMEGNFIADIESDEFGRPFFIRPDYIAIHPDAKQLYVSDWCTGNVTAVKLGSSKNPKIIKQFWNPHGLTVDNEGFIYVVECGTCNIRVFHPDRSDVQVLIENDAPFWKPLSVCYCDKANKLYVGMAGNKVKVFKVIDREYVKCESLEKVEKWLQV